MRFVFDPGGLRFWKQTTFKGKIRTLNCYDAGLTSLDVSRCAALEGIGCGKNKLTALDLSKNTALAWLGCGYN